MNATYTKICKKRTRDGICVKCDKAIKVGDSFVKELYNDGFSKRMVGSFHIDCYKDE